ncbi:hypothetical protein H6F97_20985 [Microcoleus sp. FACHB-1]|nr:hypothetical protein [Microcoleus sp. FACHB-1]
MIGLSNPETAFQGRSLLILLEDKPYMNPSIAFGVCCAQRLNACNRFRYGGTFVALG